MQTQGVDRLVGKLRRLRGKDAKAVMRKGCRAGAKVLASAIRTGLGRRSGRLARSVKVRAIKGSRNKVGVRVVVDAKTQAGAKGQPPMPYGQFGEYGTRKEGAKEWQHKAVGAAGSQALQAAGQTMAAGIEALASQ